MGIFLRNKQLIAVAAARIYHGGDNGERKLHGTCYLAREGIGEERRAIVKN